MGEIVTDRLNQSFSDLMSYDFTANMENVLDQIASGEKNWKAELNQFFKDFSTQLSKAELDELESVLNSALDMLAPEGRLSIISFHSLEDRMVKHFMRKQSKGEDIPRGLPLREDQIQRNQKLKIIGKAIQPSEAEISANPRSRSAVLRIAERVK